MLIKVSSGSKALARFRIARPANIFLNKSVQFENAALECHQFPPLATYLWDFTHLQKARLFLHHVHVLTKRSCIEWK